MPKRYQWRAEAHMTDKALYDELVTLSIRLEPWTNWSYVDREAFCERLRAVALELRVRGVQLELPIS